jgi:hypothetical protein
MTTAALRAAVCHRALPVLGVSRFALATTQEGPRRE